MRLCYHSLNTELETYVDADENKDVKCKQSLNLNEVGVRKAYVGGGYL